MEEGLEMFTPKQPNQLNGAALAYLGDAIYETYVRRFVLAKGLTSPNLLHRAAVPYVEASGQAHAMREWVARGDYLTEQEYNVYKRGRNFKTNTRAKNASLQDYRQATGFEALLGWLYLQEEEERIKELVVDALKRIEEGMKDDNA